MRPHFADYFDYNPDTGILTWKLSTAKRITILTEAGKLNNKGYREVCLFNKTYKVHRIAWEIYHGREPVGWMDHINGIRDDNRIVNLREGTPKQNAYNRKTHNVNKLGIKGLSVNKGRYYVASCCGIVKYFPLTEEGKAAALDWLAEQRKSHGEFANDGGTP